LSAAEVDELLTTSWNLRLASHGPGHRINVTPLWFVWVGGRIYAYCRGQKLVNLRRNPHATVVVDRNERERQGAMLQGTATVLEDADGPGLDEVRALMAAKYGVAPVARSGWRWVVFVPINVVTWHDRDL
jgi:nitroimidazol reductase NimA-like FMN-containing flavoprotein (pyridoxamine 5'-phosphate oxidase superfamily)